MTEKELSELYMRIVLQFDSVLGTLVSKNLVFSDLYPGSEKIFTILSTRKREKTLKESLPIPRL